MRALSETDTMVRTGRTAPGLIFDAWEPGLSAAQLFRQWMAREGLAVREGMPHLARLARVEAALAVDPKVIPVPVRQFLDIAEADWRAVLGSANLADRAARYGTGLELSTAGPLASSFAIRSLKNLPEWHERWRSRGSGPIQWSCFLLCGLRTCLKRDFPSIRVRSLTEAQIRGLSMPVPDRSSPAEAAGVAWRSTRMLFRWLGQQDPHHQRVLRLKAGLWPARRPWTPPEIARALGWSEEQLRRAEDQVRAAARALLPLDLGADRS